MTPAVRQVVVVRKPVRLRFISALAAPNSTNDVTSAGNEARESRLPHFIPDADIRDIRLVYGSWFTNLGSGGGETAIGNGVSVASALEVGSTTVVSADASVASPTAVADGATFITLPYKPSDFGLSVFPRNTGIFSRTRKVVTIGQALPRSGMYGSEDPARRRQHPLADASELAATGLMTTGTSGNSIGPIGMIADLGNSPIKSMIGLGNSFLMGDGDGNPYPSAGAQGGWPIRASTSGGVYDKPFARLGRSGGTLVSFVITGRYERRLALLPYCDAVLLCFPQNDLFETGGAGTTNYDIFKTNMLTLIARIRAITSVPVYAVTCTPRTTGPDYSTAASQGIQTNWVPANVQDHNTVWLPARVADGTINGIFPLASYCENGLDNTKWINSGTADGTHPTPTIHASIAAGFRTWRTSIGL